VYIYTTYDTPRFPIDRFGGVALCLPTQQPKLRLRR
jgi:hypothetical protein